MKEERVLYVATRQPGQDLKVWMDCIMGAAICDDHRLVSPRCQNTYTEYAKIYLKDNAPGIGMASPNG